jgi:hypothetical protein
MRYALMIWEVDSINDVLTRPQDFTTIGIFDAQLSISKLTQAHSDWVQDAAKEQLRRKLRRKETAGFFERGGHAGWRYRLWESYEAAQGWIVVTLIGNYGRLE